MEVFQNYDWPGNIRELQNTIERLKILAENNEIKLDDIPFSIRMPKSKVESGGDFSVDMPLEDVEKNHILRTLTYHHGNKTKTAQSLGITIKTTKMDLSAVTQEIGKAGKQFGKLADEVRKGTAEVKSAREKAEQIAKVFS